MLPYLRLGPFLLQTPALALLIGFWLGSWLAEKEAVRLRLNQKHISEIVFNGFIAGIVGARLAYASQYLNVYAANPLSLFAPTLNTLDATAGALIGITASVIFAQRKQLPLRPTLDALAPGLAIFMVALGTTHILSGDAFGAPANLPWSIFLWSDYRHPSQIYETLVALIIFGLARIAHLGQPGSGVNFLIVVALSAGASIFLEAFRGDSLIVAGGFRTVQVVGLIILAAALWMIGAWSQASPAPITEETT